MDRRKFLINSSAFLAINGGILSTPFSSISAQQVKEKKQLILIELKGGNDGINTFIPYRDPLYRKLRPNLSIKSNKVLTLDESYGFHPSMSFLHQEAKKGHVAIINGVGYENPNLSHFRSIDIWETGTSSEVFSTEGWINPYLKQIGKKDDLVKGIVLGENSFGPFRGATNDILVMNNPKRFLRKNNKTKIYQERPGLESLNHIISVENSLSMALEEIKNKTKRVNLPNIKNLPQDRVAGSIKALLTIIAAGHHIPIIKISLNGFDTHTEQENTHARLLKNLDQTFQSLKAGLEKLNRWDQTVIATYSEFGRRPKENGSRGTDHGTANVHFVMGGKIKGGLYGKVPSLDDLDGEGNVHFGLDYRSYYSVFLKNWFGLKNSQLVRKWGQNSLNFIRS